MSVTPLKSLADYSRYIAETLERPSVQGSTLVAWSDSPYTGTAEGEIIIKTGVRLRVREELDFELQRITSYGYEVYRDEERLYWYDDFPHPLDTSLASTFPHHRHEPPNIKRHRVPAPQISYERPNLAVVIDEAERL